MDVEDVTENIRNLEPHSPIQKQHKNIPKHKHVISSIAYVEQNSHIQQIFLENMQMNKTTVAIYLLSGIKLQGQIVAFDNYVLLLKGPSMQVIYKHAISTVMPIEHEIAR